MKNSFLTTVKFSWGHLFSFIYFSFLGGASWKYINKMFFMSLIPQTLKLNFFLFQWKKNMQSSIRGRKVQKGITVVTQGNWHTWNTMPARRKGRITPRMGSLASTLTVFVALASNFFLLCLFFMLHTN